jgi:hypothetical protein
VHLAAHFKTLALLYPNQVALDPSHQAGDIGMKLPAPWQGQRRKDRERKRAQDLAMFCRRQCRHDGFLRAPEISTEIVRSLREQGAGRR